MEKHENSTDDYESRHILDRVESFHCATSHHAVLVRRSLYADLDDFSRVVNCTIISEFPGISVFLSQLWKIHSHLLNLCKTSPTSANISKKFDMFFRNSKVRIHNKTSSVTTISKKLSKNLK